MKILFIFDGLNVGGIERVGLNYINLLYKNNEIYVINLRPKLNSVETEMPSSVKIFHIYYPRSITPYRYGILKRKGTFGKIVYRIFFVGFICINYLYRLFYYHTLKKVGIVDVAIAFSGHYNDLTFTYFNYKHSTKKIIGWVHGSIYSYNILSPSYFQLYKKIENLVCLSEKDDEKVKSFCKENKINKVKIYNPINLEKRNIDSKKIENLKRIYGDYILMVGRLAKDKDQATLIKAVYILKTKYQLNKKLLLVGDGPQKEFLEKIIKNYHLEKEVIICGSRKDVQNYYLGATIYAHSSPAEGLPTVLLEAMYYHLPIASTNSEPGVQEILQNKCGLISEVGNPEQLSENIYKLYTSRKLRKILIEREDERIKDFLPDCIIKKLDNFIKENI